MINMNGEASGYEVSFFDAFRKEEGGLRRFGRVGRGSDGALWVDPRVLGVEPEVMLELEDYPGPLVLFDFERGRVYVNAQAVVSTFKCPEARKRKMALIDELVDRLHPTNFRG
jgi:hypothetical protein